ncbi:MAG TPA: hypothetical protein VHQ94_09900 [Pyrinomonadaceae bacterium]|jgi:hypothetical protein|nr:hypothetical protein [Pyrinomonadaceae bacterium]
MIKTQYARLLILLFVCLATGSSLVHAQTTSKHACSNSKPATFTITCKDRYYLGETITITLSNNNLGRTLMTVKEFEHQKFFLEVTGLFSNDSVVEKKSINYDGSIYIPPARSEGGITFWYAPVVRPPKYVTLRPGESTTLTLVLSESFSAGPLGVGRYKLVFKSPDGQKVVKEFDVYFDIEKTTPLLVKELQTEGLTGRNAAIYNLSKFNRPVLRRTAEELVATGDEKQREYARSLLADIEHGNFSPLELVLITQARYSRSANPAITISVRNRSGSPEPVQEAEQQNFFLELRKVVHPGKPDEYFEDIKTCVYTPKESPQNANPITLGPGESTSVIVNLQQCFGAPLDAGDYHLIVKRDPDEQRDWKIAERKFDIRGR